MAVLPGVTELSSSDFTWVAERKVFVSEISDFKGKNLEHQIFDDACDYGFVMKSAKTGKVVPFAFSTFEKDSEGDILMFIYVPVDRALFEMGVKVVLLND